MPQHPEALFYFSQIKYEKDDFDRALTDIEDARVNANLKEFVLKVAGK